MTRGRSRTWLLAGVSAVVLLVASSEARAREDGGGDDLHTLRVVGTVALSLVDIGFLAGDLYYGSEGDWLPPYGAWTQLVLVAPANLAMGILTLDHRTDGAWLALGIGELVLGTWFAVHGTLSLLGQPDEPPPRQERPTAFLLAPLAEGGATAAWLGRF